jgi:ABC-type multidrug transport system fused ATPase/permease subunit
LLIIALFVGKAVLAAAVLRRVMRSLARTEAALTNQLMVKLMKAPLTFHLKRRDLEVMTDVTLGAEALLMKVVAPTVLIAAEFVLMAMLGLGLLVLAPAVAIGSLAYFAAVLAILHRWIGRRSSAAGKIDAESTRTGMVVIQWALGGYREVVTRGVTDHFVDRLHGIRNNGAGSRAEVAYLGLLPRYFLESALVVGMAVAFAVQLPFTGIGGALSGLALFAVAGFRLLPSLQRVQGSAATIKAGQPFGERTLSLMQDLDEVLALEGADGGRQPLPDAGPGRQGAQTPTLRHGIQVEDVSFTYDGGAEPALRHVSAFFPAGAMTAMVGASGSGKSTLIDLLLGLLSPSGGRVLVDGAPLQDVRNQWRSIVGYVPQFSFIMPTSIRSNVALGVADQDVDDDAVWAALRRASLDAVVEKLPGRLDFELGDAGTGMSGGQRQRLGIARALYHRPQVLIFDEATSSLDVETEAEITATLTQLGDLTKIVVAHPRSTVRDPDHVRLLRWGRVEAQGRFEDVRRAVPDFARQVQLSGLSPINLGTEAL